MSPYPYPSIGMTLAGFVNVHGRYRGPVSLARHLVRIARIVRIRYRADWLIGLSIDIEPWRGLCWISGHAARSEELRKRLQRQQSVLS